MIQNKEKEGWHYLAVKKISRLLHKNTLNHQGDFYCLNCPNSFRTENKLKSHDKIYKNKDFCGLEMPSEKNKILKFNQYTKIEKMLYVIYTDPDCLIKKKRWMRN